MSRCASVSLIHLVIVLLLAGGGMGAATAADTSPEAVWTVAQPGFAVETIAGGFQLPGNIAIVPHPGTAPDSPWFYVAELQGSVRVVTVSGTVGTYASELLNFTPSTQFPGAGEIGLDGIVVEPASGDVIVSLAAAAAGGGALHPEILRLHSTDGGRTASRRTTLLSMPALTLTTGPLAANLTIGPDGTLYVHMGDAGNAALATTADSVAGKVLRLNLDGTAPADNPFVQAGDHGAHARDYIFALGLCSPTGGTWRQADGLHYLVDDGPGTDRLAQALRGENLGFTGTAASMQSDALYAWSPSHTPVNCTFIQAAAFQGSGFPATTRDHLFVAEAGPTLAQGAVATGKRISEFTLDAAGHRTAGPVPLIRYAGSGLATVAGLAAGPDGLYFSDRFADQGPNYASPGAHILRVRWIGTSGAAAAPATVTIQATRPNGVETAPRAGAFTITRSGTTASALPVAYTVSGSAVPGSDYAPLAGFAVIPAHEASVVVPVIPLHDTIPAGDATVTATLAATSTVAPGDPASATVTLWNTRDTTTATIAINQAITAQTIQGVGGDFAIGRFTGSPQPNDAVGAIALDKLHPTHARVGIPLQGWIPAAAPLAGFPATAAFQDTGGVHNVFLLLQELHQRHIPIVASVWDVPNWMVANPTATQKRTLLSGMDAQLAAAIAAFVLHAHDQYGVPIEAVSCNEADLGFDCALRRNTERPDRFN